MTSIAIIGGTGALGAAIARRLAKAGESVILGSRDPAKAAAAAAALQAETGRPVQGRGNAEAAAAASLVIVTVPFVSQESTLTEIAPACRGKIVVDTTVPLMPPKVMRVQLPAEGSAAVRAQRLLGEGVTVVSAFHNVAAHKLATDASVECDVLVFGDERAAREQVLRLVAQCGLRGLHGGALVNSAAAEALTSVLIFVNKTYSVDGAGLRITGSLTPPAAG
ncbi:MAG: NADPH-dependent F420 reductase [Gammaproteobacteria bacterium]|nr:NADPH-dependent F420 reductase [Gammaproteobacteria bacterium]